MDLSPHKNRLHLVPSQENLTKVTESTEATSNSSTPRQSKFHEEVPDLPISPLARNKVSFYSCRATASPSPPEAEDESVYTQDESVRTQVLKPTWSEENVTGTGTRRSFSFETDPIFSPLNFSKRKDAPSSSTHPAHRRAVSDETGGKSSERAKSYERLVANETERQRRVADEAEEDELIEVTRRAEEEENEKVMREQQQKKVSDTSTATAVSTSGTAPDIVGKDAEKGNSIEKAVTVLDPHPNGTSTSQEVAYKTLRTYFMGIIISMGGLVFGYGGIGQIGGFLVMHDYANRFGNKTDIDGNKTFSDVRQGTVVGLLMIGALIGALVAAPVTDRFGRKHCISFWAMIFAVGQVIEISTQRVWWQLVIGRVVEGLGIGGLSILTPLYMGEVAPKQIRGVMISCYQLFITLGILLASLINYGTHNIQDSSSWRITMGIGLVWPTIMAIGVQFLDESPRWDYRKGNTERAGRSIAKTYSVTSDHSTVTNELQDIQTALEAESAAEDVRWYDVFKAPTMLRRIIVGMVLQMMQQMTGVNYFFYYGTALFSAAGVGDSYITAVILGAVNFVATFVGLWIAGNVGHRKALIWGGAWISMCLFIYAAMGTTYIDGRAYLDIDSSVKTAGAVMVAFSCLAIVGFATTWGPLAWTVCAEIYPAQYRATCMAIATASNWTFNFLIGFFTPFITASIGYSYGFVFASVILLGSSFVYLFVHETKGRSLEAIDQIILNRVKPWRSAGPVVDGEVYGNRT